MAIVLEVVAAGHQRVPLARAAQASTNSHQLLARVVRPGRRPRGGTASLQTGAAAQPQALDRAVVERGVRDLDGAVAVLGRGDREAVVLARDEHAAATRARAPGGWRRGGRSGSLNVSSPSARPSSWWPRQMPKSGRSGVDACARTSATCASIDAGVAGAVGEQHAVGVERDDLRPPSRRAARTVDVARPASSSRRTIEALAP